MNCFELALISSSLICHFAKQSCCSGTKITAAERCDSVIIDFCCLYDYPYISYISLVAQFLKNTLVLCRGCSSLSWRNSALLHHHPHLLHHHLVGLLLFDYYFRLLMMTYTFVYILDCYALQDQGKFLVCANLVGNKSHSDSLHGWSCSLKYKYMMIVLNLLYQSYHTWWGLNGAHDWNVSNGKMQWRRCVELAADVQQWSWTAEVWWVAVGCKTVVSNPAPACCTAGISPAEAYQQAW